MIRQDISALTGFVLKPLSVHTLIVFLCGMWLRPVNPVSKSHYGERKEN